MHTWKILPIFLSKRFNRGGGGMHVLKGIAHNLSCLKVRSTYIHHIATEEK